MDIDRDGLADALALDSDLQLGSRLVLGYAVVPAAGSHAQAAHLGSVR
jgi:hypothetical protein